MSSQKDVLELGWVSMIIGQYNICYLVSVNVNTNTNLRFCY